MNVRQMSDTQLGLILMGLRAIYVADSEPTRLAMIVRIEGELSARGLKLAA